MQVSGARRDNPDLISKELWLQVSISLVVPLRTHARYLSFFQWVTFPGLSWLPEWLFTKSISGHNYWLSDMGQGTIVGTNDRLRSLRKKRLDKETHGGFKSSCMYSRTEKSTSVQGLGACSERPEKPLRLHPWLASRLCASRKSGLRQSCKQLG